METRKHYSVAEQEMVIGLYEESGRTLREFCESEGLEPKKLERWVRARRTRETVKAGVLRLVEVEEKSERPEVVKLTAKYRLGFESGARLEIEGDFEGAKVRELVEILRNEIC